MVCRYIIIGTGPAGIAAAEAIKKQDPRGETLLIGDDPHYFYSRPGLAYYVSGEIGWRELLLSQAGQFRHLNERAIKVDPAARTVILESSRTCSYDKLLLATGAMSAKLSVPGEDLEGVFNLDNMDDARQMVKLAARSRTAVVTGGGITALEIVEAMMQRGLKTHFVFRRERYWDSVLDDIESGIIESRLSERGVQMHRQGQLLQISGHRGKVSGVEIEGGPPIECQIVGVATGVRPRLELAVSAGLKTNRGVLTNEYLQTSDPYIFAAGDVVEISDPLSGKTTLEMLWGKAIQQGRVAGGNMAGAGLPYIKSIPFNVVRLTGLTTTIIGTVGGNEVKKGDVLAISRGESETWRYHPDVIAVQSNFTVNRTRILFDNKNILGAIVMGDQALSRPLHELIAQRVDISAIRAQLFNPQFTLANVIVQFWTDWRDSHEKP
jgi:NAD(P)H-nitrite reductase large subunit